MKIPKQIQVDTLRATLQTAAISELKEKCIVFVEKRTIEAHCFRCLGTVFCELDKSNSVACQYCHSIYQIK